MVKTRPKIKKTLKPSFPQASIEHSGHQQTQSGAVIVSNVDLLTEILIRLPVASILRFKSVSKHWHLLLSHKHFTQRYDSLIKTSGLFVRDKYIPYDVENPTTPPYHSLDTYFDLPGIRIVQSCNGLLLCCTDRGPKGEITAVKYYVFNPTTKQLAIIPPILGGRKLHKTIRFMGLAYHQTECVHYKLVCFRRVEPNGDLFQIQLYSSDTKKWKVCSEYFFVSMHVPFSHGVYWNGAVHWATSFGILLYFKLDVEQLQTLPMPEGVAPSEMCTMYFGESRGHIHLILYKNSVVNCLSLNAYVMNVYEMLSDYSGWFVKYQVQLHELVYAFLEMISKYAYFFKVVDVVRGEEEEDTFLVLNTCQKIITYNVHDKSFKQLFNLRRFYDTDSDLTSHLDCHRYTETLSSF